MIDLNDLMNTGGSLEEEKVDLSAPPVEQLLCSIDEIEDGNSAGFTIKNGGKDFRVLAVRRDNHVHVYANKCPHIGVPLDMLEGKFLNMDKTLIQCATHGALFQIQDGECVSGPCVGQSLSEIETRVDGTDVYVTS